MTFEEQIEKIMSGEKGLSYSALSAFLESPKHFKRYKTDMVTTNAMIEGQQFHAIVLEPEKLNEKYWILDDSEKCKEIGGKSPRSTNKYIEWKLEKLNLNEGKELISKEDYDLYIKMGNYLRVNNGSKNLINGLIAKEKPFVFEHDGFKITGKIDGEGEDYTLDLKKVANASYEKIKWDIKRDNYHMQGAMYTYAVKKNIHYLVYIDKECNVTVVKLSEPTLEDGFTRFEFALNKFTECAEQDLWDSSYDFWNNGYIEV